MNAQRIEDWLREAYAGDTGCPPPEAFLQDSLSEMSRDERERVLNHATRCAACAARS